jgi:hypothetical protein
VIEAATLPLAPVTDADLLGKRFYALVRELLERHLMTQEEFGQLHHAPVDSVRYAIRSMAQGELAPDEAASRRRLKVCLIALRAKLPWPEAIASALRESPLRAPEVPIANA